MKGLRSASCTLFVGLACLGPADGLQAAPPQIDSDLMIIENRPLDDPFGFPGLYLVLRANVSHPDGVGALIGPPANCVATSNNNDFPFPEPVSLPYLVWSATGNYFINLLTITVADLPDVEGRFTYVVTDNDGDSDSFLGHNLNRTEVIPLPTALMVSDQSTTPVFSFTDPDPSPNVGGVVRRYQVWVLDANLNGLAVLPAGLSSTTTIPIPPGIMCPCATYYLRAQSWDLDTNEGALENLSNAFLIFTPTAAPPNGDMNKDCQPNGRDIQAFAHALIAASSAPGDLCSADFNSSGVIDLGDVAGFVGALLGG